MTIVAADDKVRKREGMDICLSLCKPLEVFRKCFAFPYEKFNHHHMVMVAADGKSRAMQRYHHMSIPLQTPGGIND